MGDGDHQVTVRLADSDIIAPMRKVFSYPLAAALFAVSAGWGTVLAAKYEIKDLPVRRAAEYPAHQDFQSLVIGADCGNTLEKSQELFDTDKLLEKGFMPVLLVIENNNTFPVQVLGQHVYLLDPDGTRIAPVPYLEVLLAVSLKKPVAAYAAKKDLHKIVKKEMMQDFERKAFGEKLIPPGASDQGILFYPLPDRGDLRGYRLYLPEILDFSKNEPLIFFEFDVQ